jgi:hypothetical protein
MHECDREKASSIVHNLTLPNKNTYINNPYLNKAPEEDP